MFLYLSPIKFSSFCSNLGTCGENYLYGGLNNTCSDGNSENIDDLSTCNEAATEMGITFMNAIDDTNFPSGCYVYWDASNNNVSFAYFNTNQLNIRNEKGNPICKRKDKGKNINMTLHQ